MSTSRKMSVIHQVNVTAQQIPMARVFSITSPDEFDFWSQLLELPTTG